MRSLAPITSFDSSPRVYLRLQAAGLATATVYGLCADGRLAHVRILNVIRVGPVDLAAFVASKTPSASLGVVMAGAYR
jgi:hypothetical protein